MLRPTRAVSVVIALAVGWGLAWWRASPPAPVTALEAGPQQLAAERVFEHMQALNPEQTPHPVGSPAHARVLERLLARMESIGLKPEVQRTWSCRSGATCAPVENVLAVIGEGVGPAVVLTAHYDSVHAGAGAGDDLQGVGILLEVGRMLVSEQGVTNPVFILFTDAEEEGLLGARAFIREHPRASQAFVVVNVEARGTSGRSNMFETSPGNARLVEVLSSIPSPSATSLAYEVYKRLPNDTDFSVFKNANTLGLNFAFVGGVNRYHTPLDTLQQLDPRSVQHQGESVWAVARALSKRELTALRSDSDAVYFDLLGLVLLHAPAKAMTPASLITIALMLVAITRGRKRGVLSVAGVALGILGVIGLLVVGLAVAMATDLLITRLSGSAVGWPAHPLPRAAALVAAMVLALEVCLRFIARKVTALDARAALWLTWALLALVMAVWLPGVAPFFLLPALLSMGTVLPVLVTSVLWFPLALGLYQGIGFQPAAVVMLPFLLVLSTTMPLRIAGVRGRPLGHRSLLAGAAVVMGLVAIATVVEPYDATHPRRLPIEHLTNAAGQGRLLVGSNAEALPSALSGAASFSPTPEGTLSLGGLAYSASVPAFNAPAPQLEVLERSGETRLLRVFSRRGAERLVLSFDATQGLHSVAVEGQRLAADELSARVRGRLGVVVFAVPPEGVKVEVVGEGALDVELTDISTGLTDEAARIANQRPPWAASSQWGDVTSMTIQQRLE